jgi:glycosyltransferase involved in cell wall biosynthesis
MKILFIHQNFPGQFKFLAPALVELGHEVLAFIITSKNLTANQWQGVNLIPYKLAKSSTPNIHPWVADLETKVIRGEACFRAALELKKSGFTPDIVVAHHGWGESMFVKEIWPNTKVGLYCEFFYKTQGADTGFDPEFPEKDPGDICRLKLKNLNNLIHFEFADAGISPTHWQASTFPKEYQNKISVVHDGIDTQVVCPNSNIQLNLQKADGTSHQLSRKDEVITFVNRNLEPYRGYHTFMRALPELLKQRPHAKVLIVGGSDISYGARPDKKIFGADNWKEVFINEVKDKISAYDWTRVEFLGHIPYQYFIHLLQLSTVHIYLTYPFVLSWSLLESMSAGCAIVASDTQPIHEAIQHNETGRLFNFFSPMALVTEVCFLLDNPMERERLGKNARFFAQKNYDLKNICLPAQLEWVQKLKRS